MTHGKEIRVKGPPDVEVREMVVEGLARIGGMTVSPLAGSEDGPADLKEGPTLVGPSG
jgi:hypothetical protein